MTVDVMVLRRHLLHLAGRVHDQLLLGPGAHGYDVINSTIEGEFQEPICVDPQQGDAPDPVGIQLLEMCESVMGLDQPIDVGHHSTDPAHHLLDRHVTRRHGQYACYWAFCFYCANSTTPLAT